MDTDTHITADESPAIQPYYAGLAAQGKQDALANSIESMWLAHDSMHSTVREYRQELRLLNASTSYK